MNIFIGKKTKANITDIESSNLKTWMDGWTEGWKERWMEVGVSRWMGGQMDGWMGQPLGCLFVQHTFIKCY
jgi:hypothetical protein